MWSETSHSHSSLQQDGYTQSRVDYLRRELAERNLIPDLTLRRQFVGSLAAVGNREWEKLPKTISALVDRNKAIALLGSGFGLTEFLIAPVKTYAADALRLCSLGALVNLIIVICDRLLDAGADVESVLPPAELAAGGGDSSAVMILLRLYSQELDQYCMGSHLRRTISQIIIRMFAAEIDTVRCKCNLPYRSWLRKSSLPFVLMGIPIWCFQLSEIAALKRHLRWLFRVGRFFGALDDFVDYNSDVRLGHPNIWRIRTHIPAEAAARRVAAHAESVLRDWDSLVSITCMKTMTLRDTFRQILWSWVESSGP